MTSQSDDPSIQAIAANGAQAAMPDPSIRVVLSAFLLTKILEIAAVFLISKSPQDLDNMASLIASAVSLVVFPGLVMAGTRQSLPQLLAATTVRRPPLAGNVLAWLIISVPIGVIFRLGMSGTVFGVFEIFDPARLSVEFDSLMASYQDASTRVDAALAISFLVAAFDEELCYRRIMQPYLCRRFGFATGILGIATLFAAMHLNAAVILAGLSLALLYVVSGRLWVAAIAHTASNLTFPLMGTLHVPLNRDVFFATCYAAALLLIAAMWFAVMKLRRSPPVYD